MQQSADGARISGGHHFHFTACEVLHPTVEAETRGVLRSRGAIVDALNAADHDATNREARSHRQSAESRDWVERKASAARFLARTAFMRAGPKACS